LLDLSRVKNSAGTLHIASADTADLIEEVVRHARIDARARQIDIVVKSCGDTVAQVDALRFQQAIRTLVERAVRVSPPGSQITLNTSRDSTGMLHWWIHDAGPNLPDSECETLFSAFYLSHKTGEGTSAGSGLELTICQQILHGLDGEVRCKNHPNGGSLYQVSLPAKHTDLLRASPRNHAQGSNKVV
jgi:signal transduction histidine kinase